MHISSYTLANYEKKLKKTLTLRHHLNTMGIRNFLPLGSDRVRIRINTWVTRNAVAWAVLTATGMEGDISQRL